MTTRLLIEAGWKEVDEMLADAIPDQHEKRLAISNKVADLRTAERVYWSGKLEECQRRIDLALKGAE